MRRPCEIISTKPVALSEEYRCGGRFIINFNEEAAANPATQNIAVLIEFKSSPHGYSKYLLTNHDHMRHLKFRPPKLTRKFTFIDARFTLKRKPYPIIPTQAQITEAIGHLSD